MLKITFLDVLDYSEYFDTNISNFFYLNIGSLMRKHNEGLILSHAKKNPKLSGYFFQRMEQNLRRIWCEKSYVH